MMTVTTAKIMTITITMIKTTTTTTTTMTIVMTIMKLNATVANLCFAVSDNHIESHS